jgi:transposase
MIFSTRRTQILMCKSPTDMRLGYDGLQRLAKRALSKHPHQGQYFVFVNRRRSSCKVYTYDGSGDVLICKRLSRGVFCRPNPHYKKQIRLSGSEFSQFFEGLNVGGRLLESLPHHRRTNKKSLRWIQPYRRIVPVDSQGRGVSTPASDSPTRTE